MDDEKELTPDEIEAAIDAELAAIMELTPDEIEAVIQAELAVLPADSGAGPGTGLAAFSVDSSAESGTEGAKDELSFEDCCRIILEDWPLRQEGARQASRDYYRRLLSLLTNEFGIEWQDDWGVSAARLRGIPVVLHSMPRRFPRHLGPYSGFVEYSFAPGERQVSLLYRKRLGEGEAALRQGWVDLFRDLALLCWPEAASRRTSWTRLRALGLGAPPDDDDFF
jgi:hypothetical protein